MPDTESRRKAGAAGVDTTGEDGKKPRRRRGGDQPSRNTPTRDQQAKVFNLELLEFEVERSDGTKVRFGVPTSFTIGDITQRKAIDDLDAFARLVVIETQKLVGDDGPRGVDIFKSKEHAPYVEVALAESNVRDFCRRLTAKVGRIIDEHDTKTQDRPSVEDIQLLSGENMMLLSLWYLRRWAEVLRNQKNALRIPRKTTGA